MYCGFLPSGFRSYQKGLAVILLFFEGNAVRIECARLAPALARMMAAGGRGHGAGTGTINTATALMILFPRVPPKPHASACRRAKNDEGTKTLLTRSPDVEYCAAVLGAFHHRDDLGKRVASPVVRTWQPGDVLFTVPV